LNYIKLEIGDTGHVMVLGNQHNSTTFMKRYNQTAYWVHVIDSSEIKHHQDSRCKKTLSPENVIDAQDDVTAGTMPLGCETGVGAGALLVSVDEEMRPVAFQFTEKSTARYYPMAMARVNLEFRIQK
jgi:hypothetical protein